MFTVRLLQKTHLGFSNKNVPKYVKIKTCKSLPLAFQLKDLSLHFFPPSPDNRTCFLRMLILRWTSNTCLWCCCRNKAVCKVTQVCFLCLSDLCEPERFPEVSLMSVRAKPCSEEKNSDRGIWPNKEAFSKPEAGVEVGRTVLTHG